MKGAIVRYERTEVECYSGYKANERPIAFTWKGKRKEITEIIERWYDGGVYSSRPRLDYYKVKTEDGRVFMLRYCAFFDMWAARPLGRYP